MPQKLGLGKRLKLSIDRKLGGTQLARWSAAPKL